MVRRQALEGIDFQDLAFDHRVGPHVGGAGLPTDQGKLAEDHALRQGRQTANGAVRQIDRDAEASGHDEEQSIGSLAASNHERAGYVATALEPGPKDGQSCVVDAPQHLVVGKLARVLASSLRMARLEDPILAPLARPVGVDEAPNRGMAGGSKRRVDRAQRGPMMAGAADDELAGRPMKDSSQVGQKERRTGRWRGASPGLSSPRPEGPKPGHRHRAQGAKRQTQPAIVESEPRRPGKCSPRPPPRC